MANGILGLTRPSGGIRDLTGSRATRMNQARERLIKSGKPVGALTLADLEAEVVRHAQEQDEREQRYQEEQRTRAQRKRDFLTQLRAAEPGDEVEDETGRSWRVEPDGSLSDLGAQ